MIDTWAPTDLTKDDDPVLDWPAEHALIPPLLPKPLPGNMSQPLGIIQNNNTVYPLDALNSSHLLGTDIAMTDLFAQEEADNFNFNHTEKMMTSSYQNGGQHWAKLLAVHAGTPKIPPKSPKHKKQSQLSKGVGYGPAITRSQLEPVSRQLFDNSADWELYFLALASILPCVNKTDKV